MSTTTLTKAGTKNVEQVILLDATTGDPASLGGGTQYADGATAATPTGTQINWNDAGTQRAVSAAKPLPVTASIDTTGLATSAGQTTGNSSLSSIDGKITAVNTGAVVVSSSALPSGASTSANQTTIIGHVDGIETLIGTTNTTLGTIDTDTGNISTKIDTLAGAVSGTEVQVDIVASLPAGTNAIGKLSANSGVDIGDVDVTSVIAGTGATNLGKAEDSAHSSGDTGVAILERRIDTAATSADTSGDYATANQSAEGAKWSTLTPTTTSGCSTFRSIDLDETEEEVKANAGNIYGYYFYNASASVRYLKFYNATAANTTVGTTTPLRTYPVPAGAAGHVALPYPIAFSTAISVAVTTGLADNDTGAPSANDFIINIDYK